MRTLTIFTPTYNRMQLLKRAYESLKAQTNKDFLWLIIDDGSTDETESIVKNWISESIIEIEYYKKENGGKHTAYNFALDVLKTELVMITLDSDDYLKNEAVEVILQEWNQSRFNKIVGTVYLCENEYGEKLYKKYNKEKLDIISLQDAFKYSYFYGEARYIFRSDYVKKFRFPTIEGEKFFTEGYIFLQMDEPLKWFEKSIYIAEYQDDGLTKNPIKTFINNPVSFFEFNKIRLKYSNNRLLILKYVMYYVAFGLLGNQSGLITSSEKKVLTIILYPFGFILYILFKFEKYRRSLKC